MAQSVEHIIGNDEVTSSILVSSSKSTRRPRVLFLRLRCRLTFDGNTAENLCFLPIYFPTRLCYNLNRTDFLFLSENNLLDTGEVTMRKHLCGLVIILLLCAALFALPAAAADVAKNERTGTLYDALDDALSEADSGDIITLLANAELLDIDDGGSYTYVPLTVEMNGHGISGMLTATDDLKLNNGWFYGLLVVDISGEEGALTMTAPAEANYAVNSMLTVKDGTVNISCAKVAVRGTLNISSGTAVTLSGTEKAVELFSAETFGNKFYGAVDADGDTATAAVYDAAQQTYTVGGVAAKKLSNINAGAPEPAEKPKPNPSKNTVDAAAGAPTDFKVSFTGTENLEVSIQKNALDDTIRASAAKTDTNMWTVTVTLEDEPKQTSYLLHIYPEGDTSRRATVTVNVVPHKAKVVEGGNVTYIDSLSCTLTADDGSMRVTLLDDIELGAYRDPFTLRGGSPITLDLGGHSIDYVCVGEDTYDEDYEAIGYNSANVTVVGDGSIEELYHVVGTVRVRGGTISHLSCSSNYEAEGLFHGNVFISGGTLIGNLSVSTGSYNVTVDGGTGHKALIFCDALETKITDGEFEELILVPPTSSDCTLVLSGGKFDKIKTQSGTNEKGLYLAKYLAPDYFFYTKPAGGSDYTQLVDASAVTELADVIIKKHTHTVGADGKCTECGTHIADIRVVKDGAETYLTADKLQDAIDMMQASDSYANTVTLLDDIELGNGRITIKTGKFTLDLGGKTLSSGFVGTWHALLEIKPDFGTSAAVHIQNGSIVNRIHESGVHSETIALLIENKASVTLSDVTVRGGTNNSGKNPAVTQTFATLVVEGDSVLDGGLFADKPYAITLRGGSFTAGYQSYGMLTAIKVTAPGNLGYYRDAVDLLADGYAFVKADDVTAFVTNLGNITEDVKIIPHTHDFSAGDTCACGVSYVAELNGVKYTSLNKAIAAANGGTIKLLCDVDFGTSGTLYAADAAYTLDLAGHTLRGDASALVVVNNAENGTAAVTIQNGTVIGDNGTATIRVIGANLTLNAAVTNRRNDIFSFAALRAENKGGTGSRITIEDGTYIGGVYCYSKDSTMQIMRGSFEKGGSSTSFSLKANYYDVDQRKEIDLPLAAFIADGSYVTKNADGTRLDLTNLSEIEDAVTVKVCTAHDFSWSMDTNGVESVACQNCGKRCTHKAPDADTGKCPECNFVLEAQVGDAYYAYFSSAAATAAEDGGTVKLLCNVTATGPYNIATLPSGTYTLDLAGHKLTVGTDAENLGAFNCDENTALTITSSDGAGILNAALYIHGDFKVAANLSVEGLVEVYKSLEVDSTSYAPTFNGEVKVKNGGTLTVRHGDFRKDVTVESGGKLNAFEPDGGEVRFAFPVKVSAGGTLRVTGSSSFEKLEIAAGAHVSLMGGRFASRIFTSDGSPLAPYLADNYAFADAVTGAIQNADAGSLGNVHVVEHTTHNTVDADTGKCACGKQMLAVRIARDDSVVAGYDNLRDALGEAQFGDTVRLFGSAVGGFTLHPQSTRPEITLDMNAGQIIDGLALENVKLTVVNGRLPAGSALTVASDASLTMTNVKCGPDVTVSGSFAVTDADTVCTGTVTVKNGGSAELSGGSYKKIVCETGTVADCLAADFGYTETANAESWLNGDGKTIADTTVLRIPLVLVHIGNTSVPYGTDAMLTVLYDTIDISPDRSKVSFQWYTISGDTYTPIADETDDMYVLRAGTVPGKYDVACAVTYKGYTMRADGLIGIRKAALTEGTHYTAPTAAPLVYDGNAHALLAAGSIAANADLAGCRFVYSDSKDGNYTETMPTATAAGNYTVWYMIKGNNCFEDSAKGSIDVHVAVANVTAANKDYPTSFTYGTTIPAPTKANLTVTGDYDDATLSYAWRDAAGNTLAAAPTELGSYTLHIEIAATANTTAAVVDIPISIVPETVTKAVTKSVSTYNGSSPRSYEVDLLALVKDAGLVPDGDTLTVRDQFDIFLFTDDGHYVAYDPATADYAVTAVKKDGEPTTLVITVSGLDRTPTKIYCMVNVRLSNAHYTNIVTQISLVAKDKEEKPLSVMMEGWTYGLYDANVNKPVYMVPGIPQTIITYYAEDGSELAGVPTDAGNYSVQVVCETDDAIYKGSADFTIARRDIADASVTLGDALTYDTIEQTQTVRAVHFDGVDVTYTVEAGSDKATNAGNYTLRLIGTGNYTGTLEVPFVVWARVVTATVVAEGTYTYDNGNAILPTVKVFDGNVEIDRSEYTVECENNIHAGTATVRIVNADGGNYVVSGSTTFEIDKATQSLATDAVTGTYGESGKTIVVRNAVGALTYAVTSGAEVLDVDANGVLTFKQGGDATIRVSAAGDDDHESAFVDVTVKVAKRTVTLRALDRRMRTGHNVPALTNPVCGTDYTVTGLLDGDTLTGAVTLRYGETVHAGTAGTYEILIAHDGTDPRYTADCVSGTLTIKKFGGSASTREEKVYKISLTVGEGGSVEPYGTILVPALEDKTITFVPDDGYKVAAVLVDGSRIGAPESYTFRRVNDTHTLEVRFVKIGEELPPVFDDVKKDSYYEDAVNWAVERGITVGASETKFDPDGSCTRAQAVTFLWRAVGSPAAKSAEMHFTDVPAKAYYRDAVLWAVENGIVKGTSEAKFTPDGICTRAEIVTLLWRLMQSPAASGANPFADVAADAYYAQAVLWAVERNITVGTSKAAFSPNAVCTRAAIVTFLYRALEK